MSARRGLPMGVRAALAIAALALGAPAAAHEGPPYPILVERNAGPYRLSVWADPDVGTGTFYVYVEPREARALPEDLVVEVRVRPADGRLPEAGHRAAPKRSRAAARRFEASIPFDRAGTWTAGFALASARGSAHADTLIEVTPPGQGPVLDFVLYLFPFVAVAFLLVKAAMRRRGPRAAGAPR